MNASESNEKQIIYVPAFSDLPPNGTDEEIDLLEYWRVIWRGKWFIAGFTLACTLIAVYVSLFVLPVTYKSEAVLMPTDSDSSAMSKLAGLAGSLPIPISLPSGGEKTDSILAFLNSRNLKERLITKYDLLPRLYWDQWDADRKQWRVDDPGDKPTVVLALQKEVLKEIYRVNQDSNTNLITISWVDESPVFAAKMLGHIVSEAQYYLDNEYETDAKREREFVEQQLAKATKELQNWERQLPRKDLPLATIQRERLAAQTVYTELRKQLELAKISEAKELIRFKVLDKPYVPEEKFQPKRSVICAVTLVASGLLAFLVVLGHSAVRRGKND